MANATPLPEVIRGKVKLRLPYDEQVTTFIHPFFGPDTYKKVGQEILADRKLALPTGDLTAALLKAAYCFPNVPAVNDAPEFVEVRQNMRDGWFWIYQVNLWTPEGVYVRHDPEAKGAGLKMNIRTLDEMLKGGTEVHGVRFSEDGTIRFAPKRTYRLGEHIPESLAADGFMVASCGVEGAKRMAKVAGTFKYKPRTLGLDVPVGRYPIKRVSSAVSGHGCGGLNFFGNYAFGAGGDEDGDGYASGVLKSAPRARKVAQVF